jgi:sugar porter (SP) family MFS transporter
LVNLGAGIGAFLSFFLNDRLGRVQTLRVYQALYAAGSLVSCFSYGNLGALYFGRILAGLGIGACTVVGPMAIAELAPRTTRGLMTLWFNVCMLSGQMTGIFVVYGCNVHIAPSKVLQYQVPWFVQVFVPALAIALSFFIVESPRFLAIRNRPQEALAALIRLRGLPEDHPYLQQEYREIVAQIHDEALQFRGQGFASVAKETFGVRANLRRVQLTLVAYILAQLSGANSITNYLPTIFGLIGVKGTGAKLYSTGFYGLAKLLCCVAASLFFVDVLGRRTSLLAGIAIQMACHAYLAGYLRVYTSNGHSVSKGASDAAIAAIYIHALGWAIGLYTLPYLFGAELWPNRIRSFGGALSQCFHWLFYFAITKATPSILSSMHVWGAFLFFLAWCLVAWLYTFFFVPETAGLSLEQMDRIFARPITQMRRAGRECRLAADLEHADVPGKVEAERKPSSCSTE